MKFEAARDAIQWMVWVNSLGVLSGGSFVPESEDLLDLKKCDTGSSNLHAFEDVMIAKADIEKLFISCFPQQWLQRVMLHWAVDGFMETIEYYFHKISPFHSKLRDDERRDMLYGWAFRLTDVLYANGYLRTNKVKLDELQQDSILALDSK